MIANPIVDTSIGIRIELLRKKFDYLEL